MSDDELLQKLYERLNIPMDSRETQENKKEKDFFTEKKSSISDFLCKFTFGVPNFFWAVIIIIFIILSPFFVDNWKAKQRFYE
jgi:hypothetical protein